MSPVSAVKLKKDLFSRNAVRYYEERMSDAERLEELEAIRQGDEDIAAGRFSPADEVFARLEARNKEMLKKAGY